VEKVAIYAPLPADVMTVSVRGTSVPMDPTQAYALVVSGSFKPTPPAPCKGLRARDCTPPAPTCVATYLPTSTANEGPAYGLPCAPSPGSIDQR
jgi:hypothetical protein